jgi:hypothetical protein
MKRPSGNIFKSVKIVKSGQLLKGVANALSPADPELIEKTLERLAEQDMWNDVFSTKLIETLDALETTKSTLDRARNEYRLLSQTTAVVGGLAAGTLASVGLIYIQLNIEMIIAMGSNASAVLEGPK